MTITESAHFPSADRPVELRNVAYFRGMVPPQHHPLGQVEAVMRSLPSHGWTAGWLGRRDRALLVLSQFAGLSAGQIGALTAGDLTIADGVATIRTSGGKTTLRLVDDDLLCGPCALARWVHALDLTVVYPDGRVIASVIARAVPLTANSPHLCQSNNAITPPTQRVALLPPVDHWGHPVRVVQPSSAATRTTRAGAGRVGATARLAAGPAPRSTPPSPDLVRAQALAQRIERLLDPGFTR